MSYKIRHITTVFSSILFMLCLSLNGVEVMGQSALTPQSPSPIENPKFKRVVDNSLSFDIDTISVGELKKCTTPYLLLDAREQEEFDVSHIKGAMYLGYDDPDYSVFKNVSEDTPIIVYCSIGYRSEKIAHKIKRMGFENVRNLYGSIFEWANQGNELCDDKDESTNVVHGYNRSWSKWITNPSLKVTY